MYLLTQQKDDHHGPYIRNTPAHKIAALQQYQRNANQFGYGNNIRTDHMVQLDGAGKWHRVYAICHSNCASLYVVQRGNKLFISDL